ncbi:MAG: DJ-1/PfpI family protein [Asgard group archaeon]|nr:DJ-1/PfpI family protein [Asgard group archaeon]
MRNKTKNMTKLMIICLFFIVIFQGVEQSSQFAVKEQNQIMNFETKNLDEVKVLALIGNGFGDSYFWIKNQLESWGCNYTTAGLTSPCSSCPNKPQRPITPDILIADVDQEILSQFDCIFIPSGAHYEILAYSTLVLDLIRDAYEEGLVISSICSGSVPIARAHGIVKGVKVAYFFLSTDNMQEAGAIEVFVSPVVTDKRIITSSSGMPYGSLAPVYQVCVALAKEVLGYSALIDATIEPQEGGIGTTYLLTVEVTNLTDIFYGNISTEVHRVKAYLYNDSGLIITSTLTEISENIYAENFTGLGVSSYQFDLDIDSHGYGKEVVRNATSFTLTEEISGFGSQVFLSSLLVIWLTLKIRRKRKKSD